MSAFLDRILDSSDHASAILTELLFVSYPLLFFRFAETQDRNFVNLLCFFLAFYFLQYDFFSSIISCRIFTSLLLFADEPVKAVMADLKLVYGAPTLDDAEYRLEEFRETWGKKYPQILKSWDANWTELSTYFKYPQEVRTLIYTTNAVEGFHRMLRKYTKNKVIYPTDDSVRKSVYLSIMEISKKWSMSIQNWGIIMGQLSVFFEDRLLHRKVS
jgi:hypothetical protein